MKKHVVTAFIVKNGKILVLKRSRFVGSYKGKWAGVSGYIEENEKPEERVYLEILEETGLRRDDVVMISKGDPIDIPNTDFVVHPFIFITNKDRIEIDWEHEEYIWINENEMEKLNTVPLLYDAYLSAKKKITSGV